MADRPANIILAAHCMANRLANAAELAAGLADSILVADRAAHARTATQVANTRATVQVANAGADTQAAHTGADT
jgi:hypothetical protein